MADKPQAPMTTRERFERVFSWQKPDRVPDVDFGYWNETLQNWHQQGLPAEVQNDVQAEHYFGLEGVEQMPWLPIAMGLHPHFERKVLEEKSASYIIQDHEGNICEVLKQGASIPRYIRYGLETRQDWERLKRERLDYTRQDRFGNFEQAVANARAAGQPLRFNAGSLYGWLRNWMGVENLSIAFMEEPGWVAEMMDHLTDMSLYTIEKTLADNQVDIAWWWEDMCYNRGPLISPKLFEEFMVPRYKRITDSLREHGVNVNVLDCDGNIYELVPGWLRGGINCMFPIEAAHTDPLKLREIYGEEVLLMGGVNKIPLAHGKDAIDRELERLAPLVERGGFIPTVDHRVPPDVSLENYLYYLQKRREIL